MRICTFKDLDNEFSTLSKSGEFKDAVIMFHPENWKTPYSVRSRCYHINSAAKFFNPRMGGSSMFADCLDGSDTCIRLDRYLGDWTIQCCIIFDSNDEFKKFSEDPEKILKPYNLGE